MTKSQINDFLSCIIKNECYYYYLALTNDPEISFYLTLIDDPSVFSHLNDCVDVDLYKLRFYSDLKMLN